MPSESVYAPDEPWAMPPMRSLACGARRQRPRPVNKMRPRNTHARHGLLAPRRVGERQVEQLRARRERQHVPRERQRLLPQRLRVADVAEHDVAPLRRHGLRPQHQPAAHRVVRPHDALVHGRARQRARHGRRGRRRRRQRAVQHGLNCSLMEDWREIGLGNLARGCGLMLGGRGRHGRLGDQGEIDLHTLVKARTPAHTNCPRRNQRWHRPATGQSSPCP